MIEYFCYLFIFKAVLKAKTKPKTLKKFGIITNIFYNVKTVTLEIIGNIS